MDTDYNSRVGSSQHIPFSEKVKKSSNFFDGIKQRIQKIYKSAMAFIKTEPKKDDAEPNDPVTSPLRKAEQKTLKGEKGDRIRHSYTDPKTGKKFGEEVVTRMNAAGAHKKLIRNTLVRLRREPQTDSVKMRIDLCEKELRNLSHLEKNFISSGYVREKLVSNPGSFGEAIDGVCLGAPVNFRHHDCRVNEAHGQERIGGHYRVGIMTYHANGHTNLSELQELKKRGADAIDKKIQELQLDRKHAKPRGKEALDFAINQLERLKSDGNAVIDERKFYLESQFAHLLMAQIKKNMPKVMDPHEKTFSLVHLALLNPKTNKADKSGWQHNETHQIQDMHAIFEQFRGKKIYFDGKGPYVDAEGNFHDNHLVKDAEGQPKAMTIDSNFINVSVQGHNVNDGIQKKINDTSMRRLLVKIGDEIFDEFISVRDSVFTPEYRKKSEAQQLLLQVNQMLEKGKSNYEVAEKLAFALERLGIPLSIGCLSAKDRTGFVSARVILRNVFAKMEDKRSTLSVPETADRTRLQRAFGDEVLSEKGCASRVVTDNTGARQLKIRPFNMPGVSKGMRIKAYTKIAREMMFASSQD